MNSNGLTLAEAIDVAKALGLDPNSTTYADLRTRMFGGGTTPTPDDGTTDPAAPPDDSAPDMTTGLSRREVAICAEQGCDPRAFAALKRAIAAQLAPCDDTGRPLQGRIVNGVYESARPTLKTTIPPTGAGGLSQGELVACAEQGCDPKAYAALRAIRRSVEK